MSCRIASARPFRLSSKWPSLRPIRYSSRDPLVIQTVPSQPPLSSSYSFRHEKRGSCPAATRWYKKKQTNKRLDCAITKLIQVVCHGTSGIAAVAAAGVGIWAVAGTGAAKRKTVDWCCSCCNGCCCCCSTGISAGDPAASSNALSLCNLKCRVGQER